MNLPIQITFRNLGHSDAVEARIRDEAAKHEPTPHSLMQLMFSTISQALAQFDARAYHFSKFLKWSESNDSSETDALREKGWRDSINRAPIMRVSYASPNLTR
jgi:hypothetical protein